MQLDMFRKSKDSIEDLYRSIREKTECGGCSLFTSRGPVIKSGTVTNLVFVGEAPGLDELTKGEPFRGRSGKLLRETIEKIFGPGSSERFYMTNVCKCWPPPVKEGAWQGTPNELAINACSYYLEQELNLLKPKIVVAVGEVAAGQLKRILNIQNIPVGTFVKNWEGIGYLQIYHPAYILRKRSDLPKFEAQLGLLRTQWRE